MKKLMNAGFGMFLVAAVAVGSTQLQGMKSRAKKAEAPIERVIKGVSALEQIMNQVKLIVEFEDPTFLAHAKKQLTSLMDSKALNQKIKDVIKEDIEIVEKTTEASRKVSQEAYDRLKVVAKQVEAQARVVAAIEEGAALVKNAPMDEKAEAIKTAQEKIEEAQEEQGWLQYLYTGAKRIITTPVNYVFGEESSKAKTAFYTTVGAAVLATGAYGVSQYGETAEEAKENITLSPTSASLSDMNVELPQRENENKIEKAEQDRVIDSDVNETQATSITPSALPLLIEESDEDKRIKQEQLEKVINLSAVDKYISAVDNYRKNSTNKTMAEWKKSEGWPLTESEAQLLESIKRIEEFRSQIDILKQNGISEHDIDEAVKVHEQALKVVKQEEEDRVMANLAEMQRKYLKSADPDDREALYAYEKNISRNPYYIPWEKIYESRNKIREEEGIGKDFELALLVKIERKYLDTEKRLDLQWNVSGMFDTISPREINTLHDRVLKEIEEDIHFPNITAQLMGDEESNREFKEFTQRFAPPLNIQKTIESHKDQNFGFLEGRDKSANVYAKGDNYSRLFNAERMRNCIESNKFATLAVAQKWIYKVNEKWKVYAEYISGKKAQFTLEEIKELAELAEQTGFRDWARVTFKHNTNEIISLDAPNIIEDKRNGKMTIIDTEDKSFKVTGVMYPDKSFPKKCKFQSAYNLYKYFYKEMDDDARKWLEEHIDYLKNSEEGRTIVEPLPWSGLFDDPDFDFVKMKEELEEDTNEIKF